MENESEKIQKKIFHDTNPEQYTNSRFTKPDVSFIYHIKVMNNGYF